MTFSFTFSSYPKQIASHGFRTTATVPSSSPPPPLSFMHPNTTCYSQGFALIGLLFFSIASCLWGGSGQTTFDVLAYGAKGDGHSDDTQAFVKAWKALCGVRQDTMPKLMIPAGHSYFVRQIRFKGPCLSNQVHIQILGNLLAPQRNVWGECSRRWLYFLDIGGMRIEGSGVINGQGQAWWGNALLFERCDGLQISGLTLINGPGSHIFVVHTKDVTISHVNITSPEHSRNTDGIDISNSVRVNIHNSIIGTGDDCIAIKGGTQFLEISQVICGPGHGISVGSLGENGQTEFAEEIHIWNCTFNGASYGARIKTWPGGKGYVKAITFESIIVNQTNYSLYIDQHYMFTLEKPDALKVSDVTFIDIHGTCSNENAIVLDCAKIGCNNITLSQINITSIDPTKPASTICNNVQGTATNVLPYVPCLH